MTKLGNGFSAEKDNQCITLYKLGGLIKRVDIRQAINRRLFIVELVNDLGVSVAKVAEALQISRQTVYNTLDTYQHFGPDGLLHSEMRSSGNKARQHEERRRKECAATVDNQGALELSDEAPEHFNQTHDWQKSRYAGGLIFSTLLQKDWNFTSFFAAAYGKLATVFILFVQMLVQDIKSIEQLKAIKNLEMALACGLEWAPSRTTFSKWLHAVAEKGHALSLIKQFFVKQIMSGLVSCYLLYADGHFIPYSGKERIHQGYCTQRRLTMPGQTAIVFHDATGRVVYFQIEEGNGDLRQAIEDISAAMQAHFAEPLSPLIISDRGSWSVEHFDRMASFRLLTWEKYTHEAEMNALAAELFSEPLTVNGHRYRFYEFPEKQTYWNSDKTLAVALRRIVIWNLDSHRRPVCVSNDSLEDTVFLGQAMLGRWGMSENGFKYMAERFNPHYIPLLTATQESTRQEIANPAYQELEAQKRQLKKELQKNANKLAVVQEVFNQDDSVRFNSKRQRLLQERSIQESELVAIESKLQETPERVTLQELTQGQESFKVIDCEAKNLFDLVQAMVWNARRTLIDMLRQHYHDERDLVNLLDHISRCHGWIKTTSEAVHVRLEPMDLPRYRAAQEELCKVLTNLAARLPNGKAFIFSVGNEPAK
jgi:transposase